jgi:RNA-dependent RNA polymerase
MFQRAFTELIDSLRQYVAIDASKSGESIRDSVLIRDNNTWGRRKYPKWRFPTDRWNDAPVPEMDLMRQDAADKRAALLTEYEELTSQFIVDPDLRRPWEEEEASVQRLCAANPELGRVKQGELNRIKKFVQENYWRIQTCRQGFTNLPGRQRQKELRTESMAFRSGPKDLVFYHPVALAHLKASYIYILDIRRWENAPAEWKRWSRRPWNVAMNDLCDIKATASDEGKVVSTNYMDHFTQIGNIY